MLRGAWVVAVAFGLVALSGHSQEQADRSTERGESHQAAPQEPLPPIRIELVEPDEAAEARQRSERESQEREKADLIAQQGMNEATQAINRATQDMALYSLISTGAVVFGTLLLGWTLYETRRMVRDTKLATDAANRAASAAEAQLLEDRSARIVQNAAHVQFRSGKYYWKGIEPCAVISLENVGGSLITELLVQEITIFFVTADVSERYAAFTSVDQDRGAVPQGGSVSFHTSAAKWIVNTEHQELLRQIGGSKCPIWIEFDVLWKDALRIEQKAKFRIWGPKREVGTADVMLSHSITKYYEDDDE